jgi:hypothetical protein
MGIKYVDKDTIGHFCGGVLSCILLQYSNVPVAYNFIISNGIHYLIERNEKSVAPNGRVPRRMKIISVILLPFL